MYCNSITNKLNIVNNFKVCKEVIKDHQIIREVGVVVEIDETNLNLWLNTTFKGM